MTIDQAAMWRFALAGAMLALLLVWEWRWPDRPRAFPRLSRWINNGILFASGAGLARLIAPLGVVGAAIWAKAEGVGLFNVAAAPTWLAIAVTILAMDVLMYGQHRLMHAWPLLWRLHAPHHADPDLDVTTGLRFHPGEFLFSLGWKAACAVALGAPPEAILAFEILLNAFSKFTHANIAWSARVERILSTCLITPRAHRLHHDRDAGRQSGNYGFSLVVWDRLFGTLVKRTEPKALGINGVAGRDGVDPLRSLAMPFTVPR